VVSGHNTPLTYMKKKKEKLNQINKDQDDLLAQLRERERRAGLNAVKASKIFHDFVSNLEGNDTHSDEASYNKLKQGVEKARHSMYIHKMRPLQSCRSFQSWRGSVERQMEAGHSFSESKPKFRMPRHYRKHLKETERRRRSEDLDYQNKIESKSEDDGGQFLSWKQQAGGDQSPSRQQKLAIAQEGSAMTEHQQNILKKKELSMTKKERA
jgi:hypothetical protein